jgi:hypothetical protein
MTGPEQLNGCNTLVAIHQLVWRQGASPFSPNYAVPQSIPATLLNLGENSRLILPTLPPHVRFKPQDRQRRYRNYEGPCTDTVSKEGDGVRGGVDSIRHPGYP